MSFLLCIPTELVLIVISLSDVSSIISMYHVSKKLVTLKNNKSYRIQKSSYNIIMDAITNGYYNLLKWMTSTSSSSSNKQYLSKFSKSAKVDLCRKAAGIGHLEILKYLLEDSLPRSSEVNTLIVGSAAANGQIEIVKWLHKNGYPWEKWCYPSAAKNGHLDILKYQYDNGCQLSSKMAPRKWMSVGCIGMC